MKENHMQEAKHFDQPAVVLLQQLKQRGILADALVLWTTEFGRTPFRQSAHKAGPGRDHNMDCFSVG